MQRPSLGLLKAESSAENILTFVVPEYRGYQKIALAEWTLRTNS